MQSDWLKIAFYAGLLVLAWLLRKCIAFGVKMFFLKLFSSLRSRLLRFLKLRRVTIHMITEDYEGNIEDISFEYQRHRRIPSKPAPLPVPAPIVFFHEDNASPTNFSAPAQIFSSVCNR